MLSFSCASKKGAGMSSIAEAVERIRENMAEAALRAGRNPSDARLMAVTKQVEDERILEAVDAGIDMIGENYVQEGKRKFDIIGPGVEWHLIGHLQRNKAKYVVRFIDMIHSVDRLDVAREIDRRAAVEGRVMKVLVEVNLAGEQSKSGIGSDEVSGLVRQIATLPGLSVQGLMTMPPWFSDPQEARPFFRELRLLRDRIAEEDIPGVKMKELSMGMSADYQVAIEEGATIVRVGRALFGSRS